MLKLRKEYYSIEEITEDIEYQDYDVLGVFDNHINCIDLYGEDGEETIVNISIFKDKIYVEGIKEEY